MKLLTGFFLLSALTLGGCLAPRPDPGAAERHRQDAEVLAAARKFDDAADALAQAIEANPGAIPLYLRRAEFLEGTGRMAEAQAVYRAALREGDRPDPRRGEVVWRLALLEALHLADAEKAEDLLRHLPVGTPLRSDLLGVLALKQGASKDALLHLNDALQTQPEQEVAAAVYYHAALAYHRLGDSRNTSGSLYHAVNNAGHRGLIRDIESFWNRLNAPPSP